MQKLTEMIRRMAESVINWLRGMINGNAENDVEVLSGISSLPLWENPRIGRMDIRRTLDGSAGTVDLQNGANFTG